MFYASWEGDRGGRPAARGPRRLKRPWETLRLNPKRLFRKIKDVLAIVGNGSTAFARRDVDRETQLVRGGHELVGATVRELGRVVLRAQLFVGAGFGRGGGGRQQDGDDDGW
jgi:hypothetical protein